MLRVWFGDRENSIYNTSVFLKNRINCLSIFTEKC